MSMTEEQKKRFDQLRQLLPDLFDEEQDARALLATSAGPRGRQSQLAQLGQPSGTPNCAPCCRARSATGSRP